MVLAPHTGLVSADQILGMPLDTVVGVIIALATVFGVYKVENTPVEEEATEA